MTSEAFVVFWLSFALLLYVYLGYPVVAAARAWLRPRARFSAPIEPSVSIVVVAHNEAGRIESRIQNLLALDYPADRLEIVIASDGSADDTVARARRFEDAHVRVCAFEQRRGKSAVLNVIVPSLHGDIILFADARQVFERHALRAIVQNFADTGVGAVSGELILRAAAGTTAAGYGTAFYWRYEKFVRSMESRADSTICATGAVYAIRRSVFEPIPDDTILDDILIPLRIVRRGYRVLFEPGARAYDSAAPSARHEFTRKARTNAGLFQLFARERWLFNPLQNRLWFETMSHKGLRLTLPLLHAALFAATCLLATGWLYQLALAGQLTFYAAALAGHVRRNARRRSIVFSVPYAICLLSWAAIVGFLRFATRRQPAAWERTPAPATPFQSSV
jgi:cellulose synthase/poly-beta-1,6-N-acetylglucosamine synthase-like glycosyltransferase